MSSFQYDEQVKISVLRMGSRFCLVLPWLFAAINSLHAEKINVMSNGSLVSDDFKLLQQKLQTLATQAKLSDGLIKQLLEKMDKVADALKALKQEPTAAINMTNDNTDLDCDSKVSQKEVRIQQLEKQVSTLANQSKDLMLKYGHGVVEENESLEGTSGNARDVAQEQLIARQERFWDFKISVNCTLAGWHSSKLMRLSNGKKYFFSNQILDRNWTSANEHCKGMGLHLATIRDKADLDAISAEAVKRSNNSNWWLSGKSYRDDIKKGYYIWHDGSEFEPNSTWFIENDDKYYDCVMVDPMFVSLLPFLCSGDMYFICEFPSECL
ncbi:uncharacterized protein LOC132197089 [Neocloeon triangulifer]|uniref:uncharacterized protein LOC132197089 n=1 Tax=Neocloeon triangulifer TaxID=2078957 RepID=UPI00286F710F|nr:uncharacterized protein LOC132197089 [Neocloeon triangulifer]